MYHRSVPAIFLLSFLTIACLAQQPVPPSSSAADFMKTAEQRLNDVGVKASRASWVQETYITDDTEALSADANNDVLATVNDLVRESQPFQTRGRSPALLPPTLICRTE